MLLGIRKDREMLSKIAKNSVVPRVFTKLVQPSIYYFGAKDLSFSIECRN